MGEWEGGVFLEMRGCHLVKELREQKWTTRGTNCDLSHMIG